MRDPAGADNRQGQGIDRRRKSIAESEAEREIGNQKRLKFPNLDYWKPRKNQGISAIFPRGSVDKAANRQRNSTREARFSHLLLRYFQLGFNQVRARLMFLYPPVNIFRSYT